MLANRLSVDPSVKVALIEAGDEETRHYMSEIPLMSAELQKTDGDWQYETVPQSHACGSLIDEVTRNDPTELFENKMLCMVLQNTYALS